MSTICFLGAGKMATAIASGLKRKEIPMEICAYDPSPEACAVFREKSGGSLYQTPEEALDGVNIVLLAVKPQYLEEAVTPVRALFEDKLVISIVAGVPLAKLAVLTGTGRIVRVMPNTPALVGEGMSCLAPGEKASSADVELVRELFSAVGQSRVVPEKLLDAVTGLSGSGPAFVLEFIQALADGGVYAGLPRAAAVELAVQTVLGTAKLARETNRSIGELRDDVVSPGGTTSRGCMTLAEGKLHATVAKAVVAAAERSAELGAKK